MNGLILKNALGNFIRWRFPGIHLIDKNRGILDKALQVDFWIAVFESLNGKYIVLNPGSEINMDWVGRYIGKNQSVKEIFIDCIYDWNLIKISEELDEILYAENIISVFLDNLKRARKAGDVDSYGLDFHEFTEKAITQCLFTYAIKENLVLITKEDELAFGIDLLNLINSITGIQFIEINKRIEKQNFTLEKNSIGLDRESDFGIDLILILNSKIQHAIELYARFNERFPLFGQYPGRAIDTVARVHSYRG